MRFNNKGSYISEDGLECDRNGKYKRDYLDMSIPYEELATPRNAKEMNAFVRRHLLENHLPVEEYPYKQLSERGDIDE